MSYLDERLQHNVRYAKGFGGPLPLPPSKKLAVVACMDARLDVYRVLGLEEGEAHVIRNAGGVIADGEIRSLAISQHLLGTTEIALIHHTDCGMLTFADEEFLGALEATAGERPNWRPMAFTDLEDDVRHGIRTIQTSPFILHPEAVRGFIFDVATGELIEVTESE